MAKIFSEMNFRNSPDRKIGTLEFQCNPPWAIENDIVMTPAQIIWATAENVGTAWYQTFSGSGSMRFIIPGHTEVEPVIKLIGYIGSNTKLESNGKIMTYTRTEDWDGIVIDNKNETVRRMSDGANMISYVTWSYGRFFQFAPGNTQLTVTGPAAFPKSMTVAVDYGSGGG